MVQGPFPRAGGSGRRTLHRVPAPAFLADEPLLLEAGEHPIEVVLLDAHLLGDLGDRDAGVVLHQLHRLLAARARAARPAALAVAGAGAGGGRAAGVATAA